MTFSEIVKELNRRIKESDSILQNLQSERSEKKGLKRVSSKFFNDREDILNQEYTFHYGGGDEFQFNIGKEPEYEGEPVFRFGLAFNFQASQSVPDPIGVQQKQIERFNELVKKYPAYLSENAFWIWTAQGRTESHEVGKIQEPDIKLGNFLFIGNSIAKVPNEITEDDIELIIDELEYLYPVYEYVQLGLYSAIRLEKIARICFNSEGWVKPSGTKGKSKTANTHEAKYGFGHEEWLFDFSKLIKGYHYASLEPIHKYRDKYTNEVFNIHLYTINGTTKKRYWIGELRDVEVIDYDHTKKAIAEYKKNGWYKEMEEQLNDLGIPTNFLNKWADDILFNVRFKPENAHIFEENIEVEANDNAIPSARYNLLNYKGLPKELEEYHDEPDFGPSSENYGIPKFAESSKRVSGPRISEIPHIHYRITEGLYKYLKKEGYKVEYERKVNISSKVDMIAWEEKKATFFEIKTYPSTKACIREALGQILEYSLYPSDNKAYKLVIVSQNRSAGPDQKYIRHLRESLNLNLEYWGFDYEKNEIIEIIK
ncbi:hypothetical protein Q4534_02625 [Cyclobacterium sp. 1_MG-2023]|uniref:hypothetical protein n=1 Tax=Cyclobacterium sp. 1_MG-2023 TaxID=3062681 RepID=UPI0026E15D4D|nr:hypothetical protein [Cyclobacterium sp. 1_MG-2023]MDO6436281.1 hypothetical protein [Cyclobacterium sp. 1_MG-2023]